MLVEQFENALFMLQACSQQL